jgi:hypothetical protein
MEPNYDRHDADNIVWRDLQFRPARFEVWRDRQKIKSGKTSSVVTITLEENGLGYNGLGQVEVALVKSLVQMLIGELVSSLTSPGLLRH